MKQDKMRAEFARWAVEKCLPLDRCKFFNDEYQYEITQSAWEAWQAAQKREPLSESQVEELIHAKHFKKDCLQLRMESTNVNLHWYRLGLRDGEAAHNITKG